MKRYLLLIILLVIFSSGCDKNSWPIVIKRNITYKVTGTANDYEIKYVDEYGSYKMHGSIRDWSLEFKARPDKYLFLSAKNNTASGEVKVEIFQRGKLIFSDETDKPFGVAVVSGFVN